MHNQVDKKLILGFDLDGVILDFTDLKIRLADQHGFKLKPEETPSEIINKKIPTEVWDKIKPTLYKNPDFALSLPLVKDAEDTIREIKLAGFPYYLISRRGRGKEAIETRLAKETLQRHKLWPGYFNENNSFFVSSPEDKNKFTQKLGINLYLDDELTVLKKMISVENRILFDQFQMFEKSIFPRVAAWKEYKERWVKSKEGLDERQPD